MEMLETIGTPKITLVDFILASTLDPDWTSAEKLLPRRWGSTEERKISERLIHNLDTAQHALQSAKIRALIREQKWYRMPSAQKEHWGCNMGWAYLHQSGWAFGVVIWIALRDIEPYEAAAHDYGFTGVSDDAKPLAENTLITRKQNYESGVRGFLYRLITDATKKEEVDQASEGNKQRQDQTMLAFKQNLIQRCDSMGDHSESYKRKELRKLAAKQETYLKKISKRHQKEIDSLEERLETGPARRSFEQRITDLK